jgi:hypothetical protein
MKTGSIACVTTLAATFMTALPQAASADPVTPPPVPASIQVPAGNRAYLVGHAYGTQNYICLPSGATFMWTLFGPQATLYNDDDHQVMTHYFSLNPFEKALVRPTWQHSRDTSAVWGAGIGTAPAPGFVPAIPWLLIQVVGAEDGPTGGDRLTATTFIQRLNTAGGVAPGTGCAEAGDVGKKAYVPYTADYFFYRQAASLLDDSN